MTTTQLQYGSYEHGKPTRGEGWTWHRKDTYRSTTSPDLDGNVDRLFAAGCDDDSPICLGTYSAECSCCYLGFSHTTACHNANVEAHRESVAS